MSDSSVVHLSVVNPVIALKKRTFAHPLFLRSESRGRNTRVMVPHSDRKLPRVSSVVKKLRFAT